MPADDVRFESRVILFFDIHSFSRVFTALGSDVFSFIQQVYEDLGELVVSTGGEIIKYAGDSMFALFPEGSEPRTVDCALRMRRAYADLAAAHGLSSTVTELEVGIASGEIAVGVFGHESLRQKDAFGDVVNEAAVLMHHRGVAITRDVFEKLPDGVKTRQLPDLEAKWSQGPLESWELVT